jgi:hypothetical protein
MVTKTYLCPGCKQPIEYDEVEDLYTVVSSHLSTCKPLPETVKPRRITDVVSKDVMEGNLITMDEIVDQETLITGIAWRDSTFKEDETYLSLTVQINEEERTLNTGAIRVIQVFRAVDPKDLPVYACFEKIQLPNGHKVYRVK